MRQALRLMREVGDRTGVAMCLDGLAVATAARGDADRAAWLLGAADGAWDAIPAPPPGPIHALREPGLGPARTALGARRFSAQVAAGKATDPQLAIARALGEAEDRRAEPPSGRPALTDREQEVARLVAAGLTNREIAQRLVLSPRTVETHVANLVAKTGVANRAALAELAKSGSTAAKSGAS